MNTTFTSAVRFEWDVDVIRAGRTDTRRLLINADTAYSFSSSSPEGDDVASTTFPGGRAVFAPRRPAVWHEVDFDEIAVRRARAGVPTLHRQQQHVALARRAAAGGCAACDAPAGSFPAFVHIAPRRPGPIAVASFDERVAICEIFAYWKPPETAERDRGRGLRRSEAARIATVPVHCRPTAGDSLQDARRHDVAADPQSREIEPTDGDAELVRIRYRTIARGARRSRCTNVNVRRRGSRARLGHARMAAEPRLRGHRRASASGLRTSAAARRTRRSSRRRTSARRVCPD